MPEISFIMTDEDEAEFVSSLLADKAVFLPGIFPAYPVPELGLPLPSVEQPYMRGLVIWYPEIFSREEMRLDGNIVFNPYVKAYVLEVLPVLTFTRCRREGNTLHLGHIRCEVMSSSFRFGTPGAKLSPDQIQDFKTRTHGMENKYKKLCKWIRKNYTRRMGAPRALYLGREASRQIETAHVEMGSR